MAKVNGIGYPTISLTDHLSAAQTITNDVNSITLTTSRGEIDVTGLDKGAFERLQGLADAKVSMNGTFNAAAGMSHAVLKTSTSTSVARTLVLGYPGPSSLTMVMNIDSYNVNRDSNGALTWTAELSLQSGTAPTWA